MPQYTDHHAPQGLRTRGTIIVVAGRGETPATYTRLGERLAADAYRVRVIEGPDLGAGDPAAALTLLDARLTDAVAGTAADDGLVRPLVLLGADTGAVAIAALLGRTASADPGQPDAPVPDAVVLAGIPGVAGAADTAATGGSWDQELEIRTACPTHRGRLTDDSGLRRGALGEPVPAPALAAAYDTVLPVPALLLVGDADPLADHEALTRSAKSADRARLAVVRGARHDVLNDLQHRSVAAEIVTFLETLRNDLVPLVAVESSAW